MTRRKGQRPLSKDFLGHKMDKTRSNLGHEHHRSYKRGTGDYNCIQIQTNIDGTQFNFNKHTLALRKGTTPNDKQKCVSEERLCSINCLQSEFAITPYHLLCRPELRLQMKQKEEEANSWITRSCF